MSLSQKKNCTGCKALTADRNTADCALGCKPKASKFLQGLHIATEFMPDKPCYKPKTNNEFIRLSQEMRNNLNSIERVE